MKVELRSFGAMSRAFLVLVALGFIGTLLINTTSFESPARKSLIGTNQGQPAPETPRLRPKMIEGADKIQPHEVIQLPVGEDLPSWKRCMNSMTKKSYEISAGWSSKKILGHFPVDSQAVLSYTGTDGETQHTERLSSAVDDYVVKKKLKKESQGQDDLARNELSSYSVLRDFELDLTGKHKAMPLGDSSNPSRVAFVYKNNHVVVADLPSCKVSGIFVGTKSDPHPFLAADLSRVTVSAAKSHPCKNVPYYPSHVGFCSNGRHTYCPTCNGHNTNSCQDCYCLTASEYQCKKFGLDCHAAGASGTGVFAVTCSSNGCYYNGCFNGNPNFVIDNQCKGPNHPNGGAPPCSTLTQTCPLFQKPCQHQKLGFILPHPVNSQSQTAWKIVSVVLSGATSFMGWGVLKAGAAEMPLILGFLDTGKMGFGLFNALIKGGAIHHKKNPLATLAADVQKALNNLAQCVDVKLINLVVSRMKSDLAHIQAAITTYNWGTATPQSALSEWRAIWKHCDDIGISITQIWVDKSLYKLRWVALQTLVVAARACSSLSTTYINLIQQNHVIAANLGYSMTQVAYNQLQLATQMRNYGVDAMNFGIPAWKKQCAQPPGIQTAMIARTKVMTYNWELPLLVLGETSMGGELYSNFIARHPRTSLFPAPGSTRLNFRTANSFETCIMNCLSDVDCLAVSFITGGSCTGYTKPGRIFGMGGGSYGNYAGVIIRGTSHSHIRIPFTLKSQPVGALTGSFANAFGPYFLHPLNVNSEGSCNHECLVTPGCVVSGFYYGSCYNSGFASLNRLPTKPTWAWLNVRTMSISVLIKNAVSIRHDNMAWNATGFKSAFLPHEWQCVAACATAPVGQCIAINYHHLTNLCKVFYSTMKFDATYDVVTPQAGIVHYSVYNLNQPRLYAPFFEPNHTSTLTSVPLYASVEKQQHRERMEWLGMVAAIAVVAVFGIGVAIQKMSSRCSKTEELPGVEQGLLS